jgi:hypothetical protein
VDGILVPGGFGDRGIEGKIQATRYARETKKPFLGICLGMQLATIEYASHVLGYQDAHSLNSYRDQTPIMTYFRAKGCRGLGERYDWSSPSVVKVPKRLKLMWMKFRASSPVMSLTIITVRNKTLICLYGLAQMAVLWRSLSFKTIHGLLRLSSIRNSFQDQTAHSRYSVNLLKQHCKNNIWASSLCGVLAFFWSGFPKKCQIVQNHLKEFKKPKKSP